MGRTRSDDGTSFRDKYPASETHIWSSLSKMRPNTQIILIHAKVRNNSLACMTPRRLCRVIERTWPPKAFIGLPSGLNRSRRSSRNQPQHQPRLIILNGISDAFSVVQQQVRRERGTWQQNLDLWLRGSYASEIVQSTYGTVNDTNNASSQATIEKVFQ